MMDIERPAEEAATQQKATEEHGHKQIYTYEAKLPIFSLDWSTRKEYPYRLVFSTFSEKAVNSLSVIQLDEASRSLKHVASIEHGFPPTKVMWMPYANSDKPDFFACTGDYLRIYEMKSNGIELRSCLNSQTLGSDYHAPLTSFDWNFTEPNIIGTSSVDTTCTIWDIQNERATAQLIAHDKEVFDIAFTTGQHVFTTVGADGSVRLFDLRNLEHSTIIYESPKYTPLLRVKWSHVEPNYLATLIMDDPTVIILDIRQPSLPLLQLKGHAHATTSMDWSPSSQHFIATGSEDQHTFIWDIRPDKKEKEKQREIKDPYLSYDAHRPINCVSWSQQHSSWLSVSMDNLLQILRL
ncbi:putative WD40 repeat protein [Monocercomonoides exilis]|uniref:putative WD40 repeat protein n=1 Tax=Monocercomonoides exilis TaxID=2049356 RepID=UPI003559440E|nr:putative WD40 repeat protein [Monocercomonoides exilis]